jgi:uncharacterized protein (DUF433 family)
MVGKPGHRLINQGVYDLGEASRLGRVHEEVVRRWLRPDRTLPPIVVATLDPYFSFLDMLTIYVAGELYGRGQSSEVIRRGVRYLSETYGTSRPLVYKPSATTGRTWVTEDKADVWLDPAAAGQLTLFEIIAPELNRVEFGGDGLAWLWRPRDLVWVNPRVQAGKPCVDGHRLPTRDLARLLSAGDTPDDLADEFGLSLDEVMAARDFEAELDGLMAGSSR